MNGIDIVKNERIEKAINRFGDRFLRRIFTPGELKYCDNVRERIPCLSARWAGKEAVLKAFYIEFGYLLRFRDIEITGRTGQPATVNLLDPEASRLLGNRKIYISLSHERDYSVAVALIK